MCSAYPKLLRLAPSCLALVALASLSLDGQVRLPAPRVGTGGLLGNWLASPIVAIGEVENSVPYSHQRLKELPKPTSPEAHDLYWCMGDFHLTAILKGSPQALPRKYLWATTIPGCRLITSDPNLISARQKLGPGF
jgi:hypothetical protein